MDKKKPIEREVLINRNPKGEFKAFGGADHDKWNKWIANATSMALPVNQKDDEEVTQAATAVISGMIDMKPSDPIEGIIISQLMAANQASLRLYYLAWLNNAEYFEASTKYLQLADKASRTVAMLTERLDHHRNQGKQQIVVQHTTTVNADQAVIADSVVTGKKNEAAPSVNLLAAVTEKPMEIIEPVEKQKDTVPLVGGVTKPK